MKISQKLGIWLLATATLLGTSAKVSADYPLKSVHVAWLTNAAGTTSLTVDAAVALTQLEQAVGPGLSVDMSVPEMVPAGTILTVSVRVTNRTDEPAALTVRHSLQRDSSLYTRPLADPVFGSDHAAGSKSWLVVDGEILDEPRSTDGKPWTSASTPWQREHFTEAFQLVDLGQVREIRKMTWLSGDANHAWFVDVFASEDGETFAAVPGLNGVNHFQKWGWHDFPLETPFKARLIKFRYRTDGKRQDIIRFPSELGVYDGVADEVIKLPEVGPLVAEGMLSMDVPPHAFAVQSLGFDKPLDAALSAGNIGGGARPGPAVLSPCLRALKEQPDLIGRDSRLGLNAADSSWRRSSGNSASVRYDSKMESGRSFRPSLTSTRSSAKSPPGR